VYLVRSKSSIKRLISFIRKQKQLSIFSRVGVLVEIYVINISLHFSVFIDSFHSAEFFSIGIEDLNGIKFFCKC